MIEIKRISKVYITNKKEVVLNSISYQFVSGKIYAIVGDSGCGKTTLMNIIGGYDLDYDGEVLYDGENICDYSNKKLDEFHNHEVGYIHQNSIHFEQLNLNDNVLLPNSKGHYKRKILSNKDYYKTKVTTLSGGEKQRLTFVRALINHPQVILADEPTGSLDENNKDNVMSELVAVAKDKILIFVTHDLEMAEKYADIILQIHNGKILTSKKKMKEKIGNHIVGKKHSSFMVLSLALKSMFADLPRLFSFVSLFLTGLMCITISFSVSDGMMKFFKEEFAAEMNTNVIRVEKKDATMSFYELEKVSKEEYFDHFVFCPDGYPGIEYSEINDYPTLSQININGIENPVYYGVTNDDLDIDEVNISSALFETLGRPKTIKLDTNVEGNPVVLSLDINTIIDNEDFFLYQNQSWVFHVLVDTFKISQAKVRTKVGYLILKDDVEYYIVDKLIEEKYPKLTFTSSIDELMDPLYEIMDQIKTVFLVFAFISIIISFFAVIVITYLDIYDHSRQVGLLKTLGWSNNNIRKYFLFEQILRGIITICILFTISRTIISFVNWILQTYLNIKKDILFLSERTTIIDIFVVFFTTIVSAGISTKSLKSIDFKGKNKK